MVFPMRPIFAFVLLAVLSAPLIADAQSRSDPFNNRSGGENLGNSGRSRGNLPSTLFDVKLTDYDQEKVDQCVAEARQGGSDIMRVNYANGFIKAPYRDSSCTRFVIEKMLGSMEIAMKDDPEALVEYKRNKDAQKKYDELKKALMIVGREPPKNNIVDDTIFSKPLTITESPPNSMSVNQLRTQPEDYRANELRPSASNNYVPSEWWAIDYWAADQSKWERKEALRRQILQRTPNENNEPTPLQSVMQEAASRHGAAGQNRNSNVAE
jgi:hypothetical protein